MGVRLTDRPQLGRFLWALAGLLLIAGLGLIQYVAGPEPDFVWLYGLPVAGLAWHAGRRAGILAAGAAALMLAAAEVAGRAHARPVVYAWNFLVALAGLLALAYLLAALRALRDSRAEVAGLDDVSGALNVRAFSQIAEHELHRLRRYRRPLTMIYLDLDDFKTVNDILGRSAGDQVLRAVGTGLRRVTRKSDVVARLGGDEFGVLLPETGSAEAHIVGDKLRTHLVADMNRHQWPVTFSQGVLTCPQAPQHVDELIKLADDLMYAAKRSGKNADCYGEYLSQPDRSTSSLSA